MDQLILLMTVNNSSYYYINGNYEKKMIKKRQIAKITEKKIEIKNVLKI